MKRIESRTVKPPKPVILWVDTDGSHLYDWHDDELSPETRQRAIKNGYRRIRYVPSEASDSARVKRELVHERAERDRMMEWAHSLRRELGKYKSAAAKLATYKQALRRIAGGAHVQPWMWREQIARRALGTR